jgi:hypothetical protein
MFWLQLELSMHRKSAANYQSFWFTYKDNSLFELESYEAPINTLGYKIFNSVWHEFESLGMPSSAN